MHVGTMSTWTFLVLISLAWLAYPFAGAANVFADVAEGKRPQGAGFSFLRELLVFPVAFFGVAALIDVFLFPWGRWIIGAICVALFVVHLHVFARSLLRLRNANNVGGEEV